MKEKVLRILFSILYTKDYRLVGNRNVLAANRMLHEVRINDIDLIYELAKCIEKNTITDITDDNFNNIYNKYNEIINKYLNE